MKINSLICIANQFFGFFMIRGCTEGKLFLCSLSKASESLEHFIIMGDFNIDVKNRGVEFDKLDEFCDLFNLTNLITSPTCFTKTHKSTIDLILTNKESCFQKTKVTETGLSDFHKLISTFLR